MRLGLVSDLHLAPQPRRGRWHNDYDHAGVRDRVRVAVTALDAEGIDRLVVLGDLADDGDQASLAEALDLLEASSAPVVACMGNHDCEERVTALREAVEGRRTEVAGVVLSDAGDDEHDGTLPRDVDPDGVVLSHFPLLATEGALAAAGLAHPGGVMNREALAGQLVERAPAIVLSGHLHVRGMLAAGPVLQVLVPALIEPPWQCLVLDVTAAAVSVRAVPTTPVPDGIRLPVLGPAESTWRLAGGRWVG